MRFYFLFLFYLFCSYIRTLDWKKLTRQIVRIILIIQDYLISASKIKYFTLFKLSTLNK